MLNGKGVRRWGEIVLLIGVGIGGWWFINKTVNLGKQSLKECVNLNRKERFFLSMKKVVDEFSRREKVWVEKLKRQKKELVGLQALLAGKEIENQQWKWAMLSQIFSKDEENNHGQSKTQQKIFTYEKKRLVQEKRGQKIPEKEIARLKDAIKEYKKKLDKLEKKKERLSKEREVLKERINVFIQESQKMLTELSLWKAKFMVKQKEAEELKDKLVKWEKVNNQLNQQYSRVNKEIKEKTEMIDQLKAILRKKENALAEKEKKLDHLIKEMAYLREEVVRVQMEKYELEEKLRERTQQIVALESMLDKVKQVNKVVKEQVVGIEKLLLPYGESNRQVNVKINSVFPQ